jgi:outer membrane protein OmpA-like peptidoglycan-associated protein
MRVLVVAVVTLAGMACATAKPPPPSSSAMCLPCEIPCTPESSCKPAVKVARAPVPKPVPPPPPAPAAAATFSPAPGAYTAPQAVEISTATPGAVIHYTTDGSAPTADSPVYTGPIAIDKTTTVQAIAIAPEIPASAVSSGTYSIAPPPPPPRVVVTKERLELKEKVFFETGKTSVRPESFGLLDDVAAALKENADVKKVVIEGHTDDKGAKTANLRLSKGRAEAVRVYLVKKGVEPGRLEAKGVGEDRPIADNTTAKGREENRRVEFVIPQS